MASSAAGRKRGRSCCCDGAVQLPDVSKLPRLEALWRDRSDPKAKVLREGGAQVQRNALALAYEEVLEPDLGTQQSGWQSVVIQGKLYHRIGPLSSFGVYLSGTKSKEKKPARDARAGDLTRECSC